MSLRYLFGPVSGEYANDQLLDLRQQGHCLAFDHSKGADLTIGWNDTWEAVQHRFPAVWQPDFILLFLPYATIPRCLWAAPVPLVGWAGDWNLLWHAYRRQLRRCDLVLIDSAGVEVLAREGIPHARPANLYACGHSHFREFPADVPRPLDLLFVGNLSAAIQGERLPWLARLASLGRRWRVAIRTGVFGADYQNLLRQARIVFNRSIRGECNQRAFEATAAGALVFLETGNRETPTYFRDRQECVYYTHDNLEQLLEHYLVHEEERRALAEAGRRRSAEYHFERLWNQALGTIAGDWTALQERAQKRCVSPGGEDLLARCWQAQSSSFAADRTLIDDLALAVAHHPKSATWHNALGLMTALRNQERGRITAPVADQCVKYFRRALTCQPTHAVAGLNLVEALMGIEQKDAAVDQARRTLALLEAEIDLPSELGDCGHFPPCFDTFRVEWEKAAWQNAGHPHAEALAKRDLLRWRLHALLADLLDDLVHAFEAVLARPDLPSTRTMLGVSLARAGRPPEALPHLHRAVRTNPFDGDAACSLFHVLGAVGDAEGQQRLVEERRCLAQSAPQVVPWEDWFTEPPQRAAMPQEGTKFGAAILWEGPQAVMHSLALVNRELCQRLIERGHEVSLHATDSRERGTPAVAVSSLLSDRFHRPLSRAVDVHVRHFWPPDFTPPASGHWVVIQPWEFGSLPAAWVRPLAELVDEVWVPSTYVRDCFVQGGVPADQVHVVPNGIDPKKFHPQVPPLSLRTSKRYKFLFVGGTIYRKGIDVLLEAYTRAFTAQDDVCLVIKDMGVGSFYRGQTAESRIADYQARENAPEILYLDRPLSEEEQAGLYTACDCLVHPYRGEGFGLPIAEAMACGLPVLVTGYGAARDFCNEATAYLIPGHVVPFPDKRVGDLETVDYPWLAEPDQEVLQRLMRQVVAYPEEAKAKGQAGCAFIHDHFTWDRAADMAERRIEALGHRPVRRLTRPAESLPQPTVVVIPQAPRPRVSLSMIVKNEEANLPDCLGSVADLVDEIIVVDTGSTDATKVIAARFGAKLFDFPWVNSFAAARNESLKYATGDWIFWLDADDRLDEENRQKLRSLFGNLGKEMVGHVMKCWCLPDPDSPSATVVDHVRLFPNHPDIRWQHRVHEQILPALRKQGGEVRWTDVVIHHVGYQDLALRRRKLERDLNLLHQELTELPDHPFTLFNLGSVYQELGRTGEALPLLRRSLELSASSDSIVRKLYALIAGCHRHLNQKAEALAACQEGRRHYPDDIELLFLEALSWRDVGELVPAEACLAQLLQTPSGAHFASVDAGLRGYKARHNLAMIYRDQKRWGEAEAQWWAAVAERPDFAPAWLGLGEICLAQARWPELEQATLRLEAAPAMILEGKVLRARGYLARQEFTRARQVLEAAIAMAPQALWPRVVLSHVLLQEGLDANAAEQALRAVLALEPHHAEARHNLSVLLGQRGQTHEAFATEMTLGELYQAACATVSDINEHLPQLRALAQECGHITVLGVRGGQAVTALLHGQPDRLVCYDPSEPAQITALRPLAGRTELVFRPLDDLPAEIEETDLLWIDSRHDYQRRKEELRRYAGQVRKYLVIHRTQVFGYDGETAGHPGIWTALTEFLEEGTFQLKSRRFNNNGLTVLERVGSNAVLSPELSPDPPPALPEEILSLKLPRCIEEMACYVRGPVDRVILQEVWKQDVYGVRQVREAPQTVIDLGAHIGAFALLAAAAWPAARIIACECDPENAQLLRRNLQGYPRVEIVEAAIVGEEVAHVEFHCLPDKVGQNSGGGSCYLREPGSRSIMLPALSITKLWQERNVEMCDFLKLDCEGAELPILRALRSAGLLSRVRVIVGEWHALDQQEGTSAAVREELSKLLGPTHTLEVGERPGGRLGYFKARAKQPWHEARPEEA